MPAQDTEKEVFDHLATLTETIKTEELIDLPANEALWRLYHQEEVTLYDPQPVIYKCTCSRERCGEVLTTLPQEEVDEILFRFNGFGQRCQMVENLFLRILRRHHLQQNTRGAFVAGADKQPRWPGILLQVMPAQDTEKEVFDHLATLTETIKTEELIDLPANEALWRLYHQEEVTLYRRHHLQQNTRGAFVAGADKQPRWQLL